jgi:hypothetical protein
MQECVSKQQQTETEEQAAIRKKTNCDSMMRKRQTETEEQAATCKKTMQECVSKQQQTETEEQAAIHKKTNCDSMMRKRQTETEEQAAKCKKTKWDCMRRKCEEMRQQSLNDSRDCNGEDMTKVIYHATKEAKQFLHRTRDPENPIITGQLFVLYVIVSSLAQKPFTNLPGKTLLLTVKNLVSKVMKSTTKPD